MSFTETDESLRARVSQLAGVLGITVLDTLRKLDLEESTADNSWVPLVKVDGFLEGFTPRRKPAELRPSIQAAFEAARGSRDDWQSMPLPVLKNRLLALTNGDFHEWDYGWPNLRFLPRSYPDMLSLDSSTAHGAALYVAAPVISVLNDDARPTPQVRADSPRAGGRRIRQDLWNAVVDYRSGLTYVWDRNRGVAVGIEGPVDADALVFPTIQSDDVRAWRNECARKWVTLNGSVEGDAIEVWVENPRAQVSQRFIESWRSEQREQVAARIDGFFEETGVPVPPDAFPSARPAGKQELTARELVRMAAEVMTDSELDAMQLPVRVVLRVLQHRDR